MPFLDINVGTSGRTEYNPWTQKCIRRKSSTKRSKSKPRVSFAVEVPTTDWGSPRRRPPTPFYPRSPFQDPQHRMTNEPYNNPAYSGDNRFQQEVAHAYNQSPEHAQPAPQYQKPLHAPTSQYQRPVQPPAPQHAPAARLPPPRYDDPGRPFQDMKVYPMTNPPLSRPAYHGDNEPIYARHDGRRRSSLPDLTYEPRCRISPSAVDDRYLHSETYSSSLPRGRTLSRMPVQNRGPAWQEYEDEQRHNLRPRSRSRSRHGSARGPRSRSRSRNAFPRTPRKDDVDMNRYRSIPRSRPAPFRESRYCEDERLRDRNNYATSSSNSYASETSISASSGSYISPSGTRYIFAAPRRSF